MPPAVAAVAINLAIGVAVSAAVGFISRALAPKPKAPKAPKIPDFEETPTGRKQVVRSSIEAHQMVYGTAMVSGPLLFAESTGAKNEFLHLVVALAAHEVTGIDSVWLNDVEIKNSDLNVNSLVINGRFATKVRIEKHLGADSQFAASNLVTEVANWTTDHRGRGIAYLYLRLEWDLDVFPTGIPNVKAVVRGKKVWDPRSDPGDPSVKAFSDNAALCQLDYLMSSFGFAAPLAEVNEASWVAAANVCDENVTLKAGGTQARYTCDGSFQVDAKPVAIIEDLLTASAGALVYQQGSFRGHAGAATTASGTLDESDLRAAIGVAPRPSRSERFNAIRGTFLDAGDSKAPYTVTDFPPITNATFETEDGGERVFSEMELPYTTNKVRAQRIANLHLQRARQGIVVNFPAKLTKLDIATWDVVTVTIARLGWSAKEFRVLEWALAEDGGVDLTLQEEAAAVYTFDPADEITLDPAPDTNLPDPFNAIAPSGLTLTSGTAALFLKSDGTVVSRIKAAWTASADTFVKEYEVQFRKTNPGSPTPDWQPATAPGNQTNTFIWDVQDGVAYDVRARAVNTLGVRSAWVTVTGHTVVGKTAIPENVTNFTAAQNGNAMNFRWTQVADADLAGYEIRFNPRPTTTWADATPLTEVTRGTAITNAQVPPGDWTFLIKAFDTSGNGSTTAGSTNAVMTADDFDIILQAEQAPRWLGAKVNFIRHHTGVLVPDSQNLASADGFDTFDSFVPNPVATATYEAPEFDVDFDDTVRVWADIVSALGPGETSGIADPALEVDYRKDAETYDGFEVWSIGNLEARFIKMRVSLDTSKGVAKIKGFKPTVDLIERTEGGKDVAVAAGGTAIGFAQQFHVTPRVTDVADISGSPTEALIATKENVTTTGFTARVFNTGGVDIGGTIDWTAFGA